MGKKNNGAGRPSSGKYDYMKDISQYNPYTNKDGTTRSNMSRLKKTPIRLGCLSDYYTLGIFCEKTNLIKYARSNMYVICRHNTEQSRKFYQGVRCADEYSFFDIAMEVAEIRNMGPEVFDVYIKHVCGGEILAEIKRAIDKAMKDPWESLVKIESRKTAHVDSTFAPDTRYKSSAHKPQL